MQTSPLQITRKIGVGSLRGYSRRGMKPSKPLPRARRESRLLFKLPPSTSLRTLTLLNMASRQFQLPALHRLAIIPHHHQLIPTDNRNDDREVINHSSRMKPFES